MTFPGGMADTDFENFALDDLGRTVTRIPITKTTHPITGRETLTEGSGSSITAIAHVRDVTWTQDEVAKLEGADGYIMVTAATTLNEQDYVQFDSNKYEVTKVTSIKVAGETMFKYGLLVLKE